MGSIPAIGQTFCRYRIVERIGAGGMGEVYRATDTKLGRDVALKVLPEAFAKDGERMARFRREAQVLASLNHPNIATIYGLEESNGNCALVPLRAICGCAVFVKQLRAETRKLWEARVKSHEPGNEAGRVT